MDPQAMGLGFPEGLVPVSVTVPTPVPSTVTLKVLRLGSSMIAETFLAVLMVRVHVVEVEVSQPPQAPGAMVGSGNMVRVTISPLG